MNIRIIFIVIIAAVTIGGISLYKKKSHRSADEKTICIFSSKAPGTKEDIRFIRQALKIYDIKHIMTKNVKTEGLNHKFGTMSNEELLKEYREE